jgi:hypothetical protein
MWYTSASPSDLHNQVWRAQVRLSARSVLRTFLLRRDPTAADWLLESIS